MKINSNRGDIQGLRALSVLLVIAYHAPFFRALGGDIGVDVFFVISGFVITQLILRSKQSSVGYSLLNFYANRVRRIVPAATVVLLVTLLASFYFLGSYSSYELLDDARWASLFSANLKFWVDGSDYFAASSPSLILHFWSLGIEEQFYFVYPFLAFSLTASFGLKSKRVLLWALGVAVIASFVFAFGSEVNEPVMIFFSPISRFWQLAIGAVVALAPLLLSKLATSVRVVSSWAALAVLLWLGLYDLGEQIGDTLTRLVATIAVAWLLYLGEHSQVHESKFSANAFLGTKPLVVIGNMSYSLYLWHFAWFELPRIYTMDEIDPGLAWLLVLGIAASSSLTYYLLENPIRHSKILKGSPVISLAIAPVCIAMVWAATYMLENFWTLG